MAIDLFCYSSYSKNEAKEIIHRISDEHEYLFSESFIFSEVTDVDIMEKELVLEFGIEAHCMFLIRINNKNLTTLSGKISNILREYFGEENIIVLWEGERQI